MCGDSVCRSASMILFLKSLLLSRLDSHYNYDLSSSVEKADLTSPRKKTSDRNMAAKKDNIANAFGKMNLNSNASAKNRNIAAEFTRYFGSASKLQNWQRLCQDIGIVGDLSSMKKCKQVRVPMQSSGFYLTMISKALQGVWVNIYDFIDAQRLGKQPKRFQSQAALSRYTIKTGRIYPKQKAKEGGPVRELLAHIFN